MSISKAAAIHPEPKDLQGIFARQRDRNKQGRLDFSYGIPKWWPNRSVERYWEDVVELRDQLKGKRKVLSPTRRPTTKPARAAPFRRPLPQATRVGERRAPSPQERPLGNPTLRQGRPFRRQRRFLAKRPRCKRRQAPRCDAPPTW